MTGGFGASSDPLSNIDYEYSAIKTFTGWAEIYNNSDNLQLGLFTGFSKSLGATADYFPLAGYSRNDDMAYIYRIAPRIVFFSGKLQLSFEYILNCAVYGSAFNIKHEVIEKFAPVYNHRFLFSVQYDF
ncbi:MAG: hypothetical protein JXB00_18100 [Bacteroidales bacterium]|nr:hypothetical protein [Bacteroidales bacterium]